MCRRYSSETRTRADAEPRRSLLAMMRELLGRRPQQPRKEAEVVALEQARGRKDAASDRVRDRTEEAA